MIYQPYQWGGGYTKSEVDTLLNGKSDTSHTHIKSQITDFPSLATVATSGSYNDLSNKPTIPTVNNATLTIQKNGTTVKTFTANASSDVTCNITVPTKTSDLTNDSGFLTSHQSLSNYSTLANTVKSISISGKTITVTPGSGSAYTLTTQDTTYSNFVKSGSGAKAGLVPAPSTTAGTTKYLREDGTWQVPPDHTYTVNNATLTIQKNGSNVATFTSNASSNVTCNITVPTKTSELTNNDAISEKASRTTTGEWTITGLVPYRPLYIVVDATYTRVGTSYIMSGVEIKCVSNVAGTTTWNNASVNRAFYNEAFYGACFPYGDGSVRTTTIGTSIPLSSSITLDVQNNTSNGLSLTIHSIKAYQ